MYKKTEGLTWKKAKAKWVRDLRSGKFRQGRSVLMDREGRFCCLGVLATQVVDLRKRDSLDTLLENGMLTRAMKLPRPIMNALRMTTEKECNGTVENHLAGMNDWGGKSFDEIADWIEENM